jgi:hypothetical protein
METERRSTLTWMNALRSDSLGLKRNGAGP